MDCFEYVQITQINDHIFRIIVYQRFINRLNIICYKFSYNIDRLYNISLLNICAGYLPYRNLIYYYDYYYYYYHLLYLLLYIKSTDLAILTQETVLQVSLYKKTAKVDFTFVVCSKWKSFEKAPVPTISILIKDTENSCGLLFLQRHCGN